MGKRPTYGAMGKLESYSSTTLCVRPAVGYWRLRLLGNDRRAIREAD